MWNYNLLISSIKPNLKAQKLTRLPNTQMFKSTSMIAIIASSLAYVQGSHFDNKSGIFDTYSYDMVKFKTKTNCALDKFPEVSRYRTVNFSHKILKKIRPWDLCPSVLFQKKLTRMLFTLIDQSLVRQWCSPVHLDTNFGGSWRRDTPRTLL